MTGRLATALADVEEAQAKTDVLAPNMRISKTMCKLILTSFKTPGPRRSSPGVKHRRMLIIL